MSDAYNPAQLAERLYNEPSVVMVWTDTEAQTVVDWLKAEADRHWWINANDSLGFAERIIKIGNSRSNNAHTALGFMARGDALKFLGYVQEAWDALEKASALFLSIHDEVGWARTRIGGLLLSTDLNRVPAALDEVERAREIFTRYGEHERQLRLSLNVALLYGQIGDYHRALLLFQEALALAEMLEDSGVAYLGALHTNMGYNHTYLGNPAQALASYERAHKILKERGESVGAAVVQLDIAYLAQIQGEYRYALQLLHEVYPIFAAASPAQATVAQRDMVECHLALNRFVEARNLAVQVVGEYKAQGANFEQARTLLLLATAEAELGSFEGAEQALNEAEIIFERLQSEAWLVSLCLPRAQIALRRGNAPLARAQAERAVNYFQRAEQQSSYATALLLYAQTLFAENELEKAQQIGEATLNVAKQIRLPSVQYGVYVLLGKIAEARNKRQHALRHYQAAMLTVKRLQHGLTITMRPNFLENKTESVHSMIRLYLEAGNITGALQTLEMAKSQILLGYLSNQQALRWTRTNPLTQGLSEELSALRTRHQWFYQLAHEARSTEAGRTSTMSAAEALRALSDCEHQMRAVTEQLYLHVSETADAVSTPTIEQISAGLSDDTLLIEYYSDGTRLWVFAIDTHAQSAYPLPLGAAEVNDLLGQMQFNIACALRAGAEHPSTHRLSVTLQKIMASLYDGLMGPLSARLRHYNRLIIVPFGTLHYLPFHLLYDSTLGSYLIEQHEVVILPAAALLLRASPKRVRGALVLANSYERRIPLVIEEARRVAALFGTTVHEENAAQLNILHTAPQQVLHIAAHGEFRIDQPDLSYIMLADGQLYTDDLLQLDLSYELVTLSACETGRAQTSAGEELIGLGRGFLYAGAGALNVSLWRVDDAWTSRFMDDLYAALLSGHAKSAALREAQCALLRAEHNLHPAFWGGFQFIGNPMPLSVTA